MWAIASLSNYMYINAQTQKSRCFLQITSFDWGFGSEPAFGSEFPYKVIGKCGT